MKYKIIKSGNYYYPKERKFIFWKYFVEEIDEFAQIVSFNNIISAIKNSQLKLRV